MSRILLLGATIGWWSLVLFNSSGAASGEWTESLLARWFGLTGQTLDVANSVLRKTAHLTYYAILAALLARAALRWTRSSVPTAAVVTALLTVLTAIFDEWRQSLSPVRTGTAWDLLYDAGGEAIGIWLHFRLPAAK